MDETFLLSNIAPQVGAGFNRHCQSYFFTSLFLGLNSSHRLGILGRLVSSSNRYILRRIRLHHPTVPSKIGARWEMASGQSGGPNLFYLHFHLTKIFFCTDTRNNWFTAQRLRAYALRQSGARVQAILAC